MTLFHIDEYKRDTDGKIFYNAFWLTSLLGNFAYRQDAEKEIIRRFNKEIQNIKNPDSTMKLPKCGILKLGDKFLSFIDRGEDNGIRESGREQTLNQALVGLFYSFNEEIEVHPIKELMKQHYAANNPFKVIDQDKAEIDFY